MECEDTKRLYSISELPNVPAVYAMYGGQEKGTYLAYVGIADILKRRIAQHLLKRDSSVATGTSAVGLNPEYVNEMRWWENSEFNKKYVLEAAELVAFEVLNPALRSRGGVSQKARELYQNKKFHRKMLALFSRTPAGYLVIPSLSLALRRIAELEQRISVIEKQLVERQHGVQG